MNGQAKMQMQSESAQNVKVPTGTGSEKRCTKCGTVKSVSEFSERADRKAGYRNKCKVCIKIYNHEIYLANAKKRKAKQREWNAANKDKKKEQSRKWYLENPEKVAASRKKWAEANPEKVKAIIKRWVENNPKKVREKAERWRKNNPEKAKEIARRGNLKIWNSPMGRLSGTISSAIRRTLKGTKSRRHWEDIVGYSIEQLKSHLEKQFDSNMTWENHGSYWEIDHVIPVRAFNFNDIDHIDFKRCWALKNLQPLPKSENRKKSGKIYKHFQSSLPMAL